MDVLLICNYWHFEFEKQSSRYRTMADMLSQNDDIELEVVSSTFRHQTKTQRDLEYIKSVHTPYKVTLLREPGYKKNVSLRRLYSHHRFAKEVTRYLKARKAPDVIICSVPSLAVGSAVTKFAEKNSIKVVIDIQDLWPEAFKMALSVPVISNMAFFPMTVQANRIYARADKIMAVSETYVKCGLQCNKKDSEGFPLLIGTDSELVSQATAGIEIDKPKDEFWIGYAGALGYSYDIRSVIDAIGFLNREGYDNIVFKIMGEGALAEEFKHYAKSQNVHCDFMGFLPYGQMMATLKKCDAAVNPIVEKSVSSIINKVSDYAMAGIPVINTQNSPEYRALIEKYNCGINCENGDSHAMAQAMKSLLENEALRLEMSTNSQKLGEEKFDRMRTYPSVVELVRKVGGET